MGTEIRRLKLIIVALAGAALVLGCGGPSSEPTAAEKEQFAKRTGLDESKASRFVKALEATSAGQRQEFLSQHPEDVRNMALVQDPEIQTKFRNLVTNR